MIAPRFKLAATAAYSGSRDIATSAERPGRGPVLSARNAPGQLTLRLMPEYETAAGILSQRGVIGWRGVVFASVRAWSFSVFIMVAGQWFAGCTQNICPLPTLPVPPGR